MRIVLFIFLFTISFVPLNAQLNNYIFSDTGNIQGKIIMVQDTFYHGFYCYNLFIKTEDTTVRLLLLEPDYSKDELLEKTVTSSYTNAHFNQEIDMIYKDSSVYYDQDKRVLPAPYDSISGIFNYGVLGCGFEGNYTITSSDSVITLVSHDVIDKYQEHLEGKIVSVYIKVTRDKLINEINVINEDTSLQSSLDIIPIDFYTATGIDKSQIALTEDDFDAGCVRKLQAKTILLNFVEEKENGALVVSLTFGGKYLQTIVYHISLVNGTLKIKEKRK